MNLPHQTAKHLREVYFGGNWTCVNLKDTIADVTWQQATTQIYDLNTIATLFHHVHYYVNGVLKVLEGGPLETKDKFSFDHPPINSQADWEAMQKTAWEEAERFASLVERIRETEMWEHFIEEKYGNQFRNFHGIVEHIHYHLGQIVLVKKVILQKDS